VFAALDNQRHLHQANTVEHRSPDHILIFIHVLSIRSCDTPSTRFLLAVINKTCLSFNIWLPKPGDLVNLRFQSTLELSKRELYVECREALREGHTLGYRLKTIHTRIIIAIVPAANTRYHHQGGFEPSTSTFIPKRPYLALTCDEAA
jgi:hypothetical protein